MSYILDALKRSEQERHQDKMPSFSAESMIIQTNQKKTHWWPYALILVLILNALVIFFFSRGASDAPSLQNTSKEISSESLTEIKQDSSVPFPSTASSSQRRAPPSSVITERQYIQPLKQAPQITPSSGWSSAQSNESRTDDHLYGTTLDEGLLIQPKSKHKSPPQPVKRPTPTTVSEEYGLEAPIQISPSYSSKESDYISPSPAAEPIQNSNISTGNFVDVPLLTDLSPSFQKSVPELAFNSHIYSDKPDQRRVMINNYYLKEGQSFDGLQLIEIGESFIKVSKNNETFKLPVLRDWSSM